MRQMTVRLKTQRGSDMRKSKILARTDPGLLQRPERGPMDFDVVRSPESEAGSEY